MRVGWTNPSQVIRSKFRAKIQINQIHLNLCKDHRDKTEVPDPLAVEDLISYKLVFG